MHLLLREQLSLLGRKYREVGNKILDKDAQADLTSNYNYCSGFLLFSSIFRLDVIQLHLSKFR